MEDCIHIDTHKVKIKNEQAIKTLTSAFGQSLLENSAWETKIKGFPFSNSAMGN